MEGEERLQIGLAAVEEIAEEEGGRPRHHQEDDDEHIGQGRGEIARKLAAEDDQRRRACRVALSRCGDRTRKTSSSRPRSTRKVRIGQPAVRTRSVTSPRIALPSRGNTSNAAPSASSVSSTEATPGRRCSDSAASRTRSGERQPHRVVVARARSQLDSGVPSARIRPAAMTMARVQTASTSSSRWVEMHDRLVRRERVDERAHLVFLVGIETVGRLVEDQHRRIVQQRLGQTDAALEALGEGLDRLLQHVSERQCVRPRGRCAASPRRRRSRGWRR